MLPLLPMLERQLGLVARTLGKLADEAGDRFARRSEDLGRLFETNTGLIEDFGEVGLDLLDIFIDLGRGRPAAGPLGRGPGPGWADNTREAVAAGRANGTLARFFDHTRETVETVLSIVGNLTGAFRNLGVLAFPSGTGLLGSLDRPPRSWRTSPSGSATGSGSARPAVGRRPTPSHRPQDRPAGRRMGAAVRRHLRRDPTAVGALADTDLPGQDIIDALATASEWRLGAAGGGGRGPDGQAAGGGPGRPGPDRLERRWPAGRHVAVPFVIGLAGGLFDGLDRSRSGTTPWGTPSRSPCSSPSVGRPG